ncbi:WD repeat domain 65 [Perkinsus olseni]|uniref:WD repeat domain 65 n=1 Tax=Perkinsus olseni TaxID=32597 RepID=A0A7J6Q3Y8_PEROL|nr:WD repeat domain 65 [Perkinsus olseni]
MATHECDVTVCDTIGLLDRPCKDNIISLTKDRLLFTSGIHVVLYDSEGRRPIAVTQPCPMGSSLAQNGKTRGEASQQGTTISTMESDRGERLVSERTPTAAVEITALAAHRKSETAFLALFMPISGQTRIEILSTKHDTLTTIAVTNLTGSRRIVEASFTEDGQHVLLAAEGPGSGALLCWRWSIASVRVDDDDDGEQTRLAGATTSRGIVGSHAVENKVTGLEVCPRRWALEGSRKYSPQQYLRITAVKFNREPKDVSFTTIVSAGSPGSLLLGGSSGCVMIFTTVDLSAESMDDTKIPRSSTGVSSLSTTAWTSLQSGSTLRSGAQLKPSTEALVSLQCSAVYWIPGYRHTVVSATTAPSVRSKYYHGAAAAGDGDGEGTTETEATDWSSKRILGRLGLRPPLSVQESIDDESEDSEGSTQGEDSTERDTNTSSQLSVVDSSKEQFYSILVMTMKPAGESLLKDDEEVGGRGACGFAPLLANRCHLRRIKSLSTSVTTGLLASIADDSTLAYVVYEDLKSAPFFAIDSVFVLWIASVEGHGDAFEGILQDSEGKIDRKLKPWGEAAYRTATRTPSTQLKKFTLTQLPKGPKPIALSLHPLGLQLAVLFSDQRLRIYFVCAPDTLKASMEIPLAQCGGSGQHRAARRPFLRMQALSYSPSGRMLAVGAGNIVILIDPFGKKKVILDTLAGHLSIITDLAFSPDGSKVASCGVDGCIYSWACYSVHGKSQREVEHIQKEKQYASIFYGFDYITVLDASGEITIFAVNNGRTLTPISYFRADMYGAELTTFTISDSGTMAIGTGSGTVLLADIERNLSTAEDSEIEILGEIPLHANTITSLAFHRDLLFSGCGSGNILTTRVCHARPQDSLQDLGNSGPKDSHRKSAIMLAKQNDLETRVLFLGVSVKNDSKRLQFRLRYVATHCQDFSLWSNEVDKKRIFFSVLLKVQRFTMRRVMFQGKKCKD